MQIIATTKVQINRQLKEVAELRYAHLFTITEFNTFEEEGTVGRPMPPEGTAVKMKLGDRWKGEDKYLWLCFTVDFPDSFIGKDVVGIFDFGLTGQGTNNGFESLLYVDGVQYQAVDSNHKEVFFKVEEGKKRLALSFRLWTGLPGGGKTKAMEHQLKRADFAVLDKNCDELYYLSKNMLEAMEVLADDRPEKPGLLIDVVKAFSLLDFSEPGSAEFYASAERANRFLQEKMDGQHDKLPVNVTLIGHTHIDVAWLWRLRHTREKAARSFSTVNRLMERYPDYKFLQTQAQLYDYIRQDYPALYETMKQRVREKRWEPAGSMWVECDCNVTSGESIVRQILYGKRFFEKEFGYTNDFLWLPDVFGYSWALPQILSKSGIKTFITTKISWNDTNKFPNDTFQWRGIDGSEVIAHFITAPEHSENRYYTYNGVADPYTVKGVWDSYRNKDLNADMLIAYGYGDGGGGVNRDMLENIACMEKIPGLPSIKTAFVKEYLDELHNVIDHNERGGCLPVWDGELYLEFHRGTYTSQAYNKKTNRRLEGMIRDAELLAVSAMVKAGTPYPSDKLFEAWKIIMRNQFHDIIPGSSIHEVYEDCHAEYAEAEQLLQEVIDNAAEKLMKAGSSYTIFNTLHYDRTIFAVLPGGREMVVENIPAMSARTVEAVPDTIRSLAPERKVSGKFYDIAWNEWGQLVSVYDKNAKREVLAGAANILRVYEDKPYEYDAWELAGTYENKCETVDRLKELEAWETDNYICVSFVWEYRKSVIRQKLYLYNHTKRIDFKTEIDWQEREKVLKVDFPVNIRATDACYDIQYGSVRRPITRNTSWEAAKFEVVAHKWADMAESGYGVSLMNDCKYGYSLKENVMSLTLLKSSNYPDYEADKGMHEFTYAIYPHIGEWYAAGVVEEALDLNTAPIIRQGVSDGTSLFTINAPHVTVDAVKKAEDENAVILRLHEHSGGRGNVEVKAGFAYKNWCECNLMEQDMEEASQEEIVFAIKPYEIKTLKLRL